MSQEIPKGAERVSGPEGFSDLIQELKDLTRENYQKRSFELVKKVVDFISTFSREDLLKTYGSLENDKMASFQKSEESMKHKYRTQEYSPNRDHIDFGRISESKIMDKFDIHRFTNTDVKSLYAELGQLIGAESKDRALQDDAAGIVISVLKDQYALDSFKNALTKAKEGDVEIIHDSDSVGGRLFTMRVKIPSETSSGVYYYSFKDVHYMNSERKNRLIESEILTQDDSKFIELIETIEDLEYLKKELERIQEDLRPYTDAGLDVDKWVSPRKEA